MKYRSSIILVMALIWMLLLGSTAALTMVLLEGTTLYELFSFHFIGQEFGFTLRFDSLSTPMFVMVTLLGVIIGQFSLRYLFGEQRQEYFFKHLLGIISSVSLLVLANNLFMFFAMWVLTSTILHRLLLFYPQRPSALRAVYKKKVISRIGDAAILGAISLMFWEYGTTNLTELFAFSSKVTPVTLEATSLLLVLGAISKSASIPFHVWLPETMENPTPVSALMHAGVINAGGFLIIRFSPLLQQASLAHGLLILIGAASATYGALVMITQNNIKKKLAYSTISQMGMMMFACGLGAYSIALFHIVAHSFYKAHAFMATGYIVEESKKKNLAFKSPTFIHTCFISILGLGMIALGFAWNDGTYLALFTYAAVMLFSLSQNSFKMPEGQRLPYGRISLILLGVFAVYITIESTITGLLVGTVPMLSETSNLAKGNLPFILAGFSIIASGFYLSGRLINPSTTLLKKIYIHLWNDSYAEHKTSKWVTRLTSTPSSQFRSSSVGENI